APGRGGIERRYCIERRHDRERVRRRRDSVKERRNLVRVVGGDTAEVMDLRPVAPRRRVIEHRRADEKFEPPLAVDLPEEVAQRVRIVRNLSLEFGEVLLPGL